MNVLAGRFIPNSRELTMLMTLLLMALDLASLGNPTHQAETLLTKFPALSLLMNQLASGFTVVQNDSDRPAERHAPSC